MLDFILVLPQSKKQYNALIFVTYKFSKRVIIIEEKNIFTPKDRACIWLIKLNLFDKNFFRELITNCDQKFFSNFLTTFFKKLKVKLFYSIAYYLQINSSSKKNKSNSQDRTLFFCQRI